VHRVLDAPQLDLAPRHGLLLRAWFWLAADRIG
jgi:hypothetical protein